MVNKDNDYPISFEDHQLKSFSSENTRERYFEIANYYVENSERVTDYNLRYLVPLLEDLIVKECPHLNELFTRIIVSKGSLYPLNFIKNLKLK